MRQIDGRPKQAKRKREKSAEDRSESARKLRDSLAASLGAADRAAADRAQQQGRVLRETVPDDHALFEKQSGNHVLSLRAGRRGVVVSRSGQLSTVGWGAWFAWFAMVCALEP